MFLFFIFYLLQTSLLFVFFSFFFFLFVGFGHIESSINYRWEIETGELISCDNPVFALSVTGHFIKHVFILFSIRLWIYVCLCTYRSVSFSLFLVWDFVSLLYSKINCFVLSAKHGIIRCCHSIGEQEWCCNRNILDGMLYFFHYCNGAFKLNSYNYGQTFII